MWSPSGINIRSFTFYSVHQWYDKYVTSTLLDFILFADDTTIPFSSNEIVSQIPLINKELSEVSNWFKTNKLSVNATKTNYMIMDTPKITPMIYQTDVILDDTILDRVTKTKFLGVIIH